MEWLQSSYSLGHGGPPNCFESAVNRRLHGVFTILITEAKCEKNPLGKCHKIARVHAVCLERGRLVLCLYILVKIKEHHSKSIQYSNTESCTHHQSGCTLQGANLIMCSFKLRNPGQLVQKCATYSSRPICARELLENITIPPGSTQQKHLQVCMEFQIQGNFFVNFTS